MNIPRIMIAGTHSGVGKTTITTAIMAALAKKGFNVQPYKVGPDYIDPTYHTVATAKRSRNLDTWMLGEETVYRLFTGSAAASDIAVIEGVMGLFDGSSATGDEGSSARVAKLLKCPVLLIVDVKSMARSAAALVSGFVNFDPEVKIAGVILNRIGSERHLRLVKEAVETYCSIPVVGFIKKNAKLELPSRHLGLVPTVEGGALPDTVAALADEVGDGIDLDILLKIAELAEIMPSTWPVADTGAPHPGSGEYRNNGTTDRARIGIAWDEAFSFYYQDGLEALKEQGAELVRFSPLHDNGLPPGLDGIYIGGGFPEIFIGELAANSGIKTDIITAGNAGMPIFAECGGLMYLTRAIVDFDGREYPMVGLVPGTCRMEKSLVGMGYIEAESLTDNVIASTGKKAKGHEFHYSRIIPDGPEFQYAFRLTRNRYRETILDGYANQNILASYAHLHFASDPGLARRFVDNCRLYKNRCN